MAIKTSAARAQARIDTRGFVVAEVKGESRATISGGFGGCAFGDGG
jgi:hypothetical protein